MSGSARCPKHKHQAKLPSIPKPQYEMKECKLSSWKKHY